MTARLLALAMAIGAALCTPAGAAELYKQGVVACHGEGDAVSGLTVYGCEWSKAPDGGYYEGTCDGTLALGGKAIPFSARGEAKRTDYTYPDNSTPLDFRYRGLVCAVESRRLKTVQNCRSTGDGLTKRCQVCVITGDKVCFDVKLEVTLLKVPGKAGN
jgi:hypothetical protein